MQKLKFSVLLLAVPFLVIGGLTVVTADPAVAKSGPVTLHKGSNLVTLTWVARTNGAAFVGTIGNLAIDGASVQPQPHSENFDVTGKLEGRESFTVKLSLVSAKATGVSFRGTGELGTAQLRGTARLSLPTTATGSANLSFTGTLGGTAISGNVPLPADTTDHVTGKIKVG
jgi:hypothetical protein